MGEHMRLAYEPTKAKIILGDYRAEMNKAKEFSLKMHRERDKKIQELSDLHMEINNLGREAVTAYNARRYAFANKNSQLIRNRRAQIAQINEDIKVARKEADKAFLAYEKAREKFENEHRRLYGITKSHDVSRVYGAL